MPPRHGRFRAGKPAHAGVCGARTTLPGLIFRSRNRRHPSDKPAQPPDRTGPDPRGLLLDALVLQRFELAEIEARDGGLELAELDAVSAGAHDEAVTEHDGEFVAAALLRALLVDQAAVLFSGSLEAVVVFTFTLYAGPAGQSQQATRAAGVRDLQRHPLLRLIGVGRLGLRDHETGHPGFFSVAAGLGEPRERCRDERLELVDS